MKSPRTVLLLGSTLLSFALLSTIQSRAATQWQQPTPEELSMTSQPEVPGADAVYLYREETTQDREGVNEGNNFHAVYVRMKILTEQGKDYADVAIPYEARGFSIGSVDGRTIHSDGKIIPFSGKPYQKVIAKSRNSEQTETVFTLPDVQVGSIIEYRYQLKYSGYSVVAPQWYVQQELFLRSGSFYFAASSEDISGRDALHNSNGVAYTQALPPGAAVKYVPSQNAFELNVHNIPPVTEEEWSPPLRSLTYRVLFYYTAYHTSAEFWTAEGRFWSKDIDHFASSSGKLRDAVAQIVSPNDTEKQKVNKIYDAVMALENTSFTRQHSQAENKAAGLKVKTADDIWDQKRGNNDEITLLFIALVRAAGLNAYAMGVTDRDRAVFWESYLNINQLDDFVAIVPIDGKEQFLDPGDRYCPFGQLNWRHSVTGGLRQTGKGAAIAQTPGFGYEDTQIIRVAQVTLSPEGQLTGTIKMKLTGQPALFWRQRALRGDEDAVKHEFAEQLQRSVPAGVEVKTNHFTNLADWKQDLIVVMDVSGGMGTASSKRIFVPASFFEASDAPLFVHDKREDDVDLHYPSLQQDTVSLTLPTGFTIESSPKDMRLPLAKNAMFAAKYSVKPGNYTEVRMFILANPFYPPKDYADLKDFYQKVNAQDKEQAVLSAAAATNGQ